MLRDSYDFSAWVGKVAVLRLDKGVTTTAHVLFADEKREELIIEVLDSTESYPEKAQRAYVVPFAKVLSVDLADDKSFVRHSTLTHDICRADRSTFDRPALFIPFIVLMIPGSLVLYICFGLRITTMVTYTAGVIQLTFSAYMGQQPYFFECPPVESSLRRLILRHCYFLSALLAFETLALGAKPYLSSYWFSDSSVGMPPFTLVLYVVGLTLFIIQVWTNRSLLERAHLLFKK